MVVYEYRLIGSSGSAGAGSSHRRCSTTSRSSRGLGLVVVRVVFLLVCHSPAGANPRSADPVSRYCFGACFVPYFSGPLTGKGDREGGQRNTLMHRGDCGALSVIWYMNKKSKHHWTAGSKAVAEHSSKQRAGEKGNQSRVPRSVINWLCLAMTKCASSVLELLVRIG